MMICLPPLIGMARVLMNVSPPAESALAMVRCRSPPEADSVEGRLAKAEARITGDTSVISSASFQFHLQDSNHLSFESFRFVY